MNVYLYIGVACQGFQDQLAHGKWAKPLLIGPELKENGKASLGSPCMSVYEVLIHVYKD